MVAKVEINQPGLYRLGYVTFAYRYLAVKTIVGEYLGPLLKGRDVESIEELWQLMHQNAYWHNGLVEDNTISGVDMALWDIEGKLVGVPVYQLFGGKCRQGIPVYWHADGRDLDELCENIQRFREMGIRTIRCQRGDYGGDVCGSTPKDSTANSLSGVYLDSRSYIHDIANPFEGIRSKIGYEMNLVHDVHERIAPVEVIRLVRPLEPYDLLFLEDSAPIEQTEWLQQPRWQTPTPIAEDELLNSPAEWKMLIIEHLIGFIRVHTSQIGGITPARKLQIFIEQFRIRMAWHGPGDMPLLAHAADTHIGLAAPSFGVQGWSGTEPSNFVIQDLKGPHEALLGVFPGLPEYKDGYVYANDKPGLGVDLDEKKTAKYPCESTATTQTQTRKKDGALQTPQIWANQIERSERSG